LLVTSEIKADQISRAYRSNRATIRREISYEWRSKSETRHPFARFYLRKGSPGHLVIFSGCPFELPYRKKQLPENLFWPGKSDVRNDEVPDPTTAARTETVMTPKISTSQKRARDDSLLHIRRRGCVRATAGFQHSTSENSRSRNPNRKMKTSDHHDEKGAMGYIFLWLLGIPIPILLIIFLLRGCT